VASADPLGERAADRYNDRAKIASDAMFRQATAYFRQAATAEYDQNTAAQAIATFSDFMTLFPGDPRVAEAQKRIDVLKLEQARGDFEIARYYEHLGKWKSARIYYNEVPKAADSPYRDQALAKIDDLNKRILSESKSN
jgi:outer membrane protein assembly factor BamD